MKCCPVFWRPRLLPLLLALLLVAPQGRFLARPEGAVWAGVRPHVGVRDEVLLQNVAVVEAALADVALVAPIAVQRCLRRCPSLGRVVLVGVVVE